MALPVAQQTLKPMPPQISDLAARILNDNPLHRRILNAALNMLTPAEIAELETYISYCHQKGISSEYLAESYLVMVGDTLREQIYFQKHKKYRYSTFAEVANDVYFNNEYMSYYMYAVALSLFLWPNHLALYRYFQQTLPRDKKGSYLEIGPGHGNFMNYAMDHGQFDSYLGVDISDTSIKQTQDLIDYYRKAKPLKNLQLQCADFLSAELPEKSFSAIVMGEVLEHVEEPARFMKRISELVADDGYIFITTCVDAPMVDHIYLFENTPQIEKLFSDCNLTIVSELFVPYDGKSIEDSFANRLPVSTAYVLKRTK